MDHEFDRCGDSAKAVDLESLGAEVLKWDPKCGADLMKPSCIRFDHKLFNHEFFSLARIECPSRIAAAVRKRQAEFFFGRLCAQAALAKLGMIEVQVGIGMSRQPVWPAGVIGSITHCDTIAAAVALPRGRYNGIGIDIEKVVDDAAVIEALRTSAISSLESRYLDQWQSMLGSALPVFLVFSAKESFFKALFNVVGRYFDFDAIELKEIDLCKGFLVFRIREDLTTKWKAGSCCNIHFHLLSHDHIFTIFVW